MTTVYFIRHGQSVANLAHVFAGHTDVPLTALGQQQAACTADFLANVPFSAFYSSDLRRAYDTGDAVAQQRGMSTNKHVGLREVFAGDWEGLSYSDISRLYPQNYDVWIHRIGEAVCNNGESVAQLQQRVSSAVSEIVAQHPNETICIATHATPIRVLECLWTNTPLSQMHMIPWVSNASVTIAEYETPNKGALKARDLSEHLADIVSRNPSSI